MKCVIVSNGSIKDDDFTKNIIMEHDLILCADGGARHLMRMDILPHVIIGDLDSTKEDVRRYFEEKNVLFYKFPVKKDSTDTELAVEYGVQRGAREITFIGALGSRMDHTLANITILLPLKEKGIQGRVIDEHNEIILVDHYIEIEGKIGDYISIVPITPHVTGINLTGLEYPLNDASINIGSSLGISNKFKDKRASISIKSGKILLIKARD